MRSYSSNPTGHHFTPEQAGDARERTTQSGTVDYSLRQEKLKESFDEKVTGLSVLQHDSQRPRTGYDQLRMEWLEFML